MPKIIAIGGVSRSGKSTLALWLHQQLPGSIMLCQDDFPNDENHTPGIKDRVDWEHPGSIHWQNWQRAIANFQDDCEYLILEGLFIFRPEAGIKADFSVYLEIDKSNFIEARRKETRWGPEPGWYIEHVWDSHFKYGLPPQALTVQKYHSISEKDYPTLLSVLKA